MNFIFLMYCFVLLTYAMPGRRGGQWGGGRGGGGEGEILNKHACSKYKEMYEISKKSSSSTFTLKIDINLRYLFILASLAGRNGE